MTAKEHNNLFGIFVLVQGGLLALCGVFMTLIYGGIGVGLLSAGSKQEDKIVGGVFMGIGLVIGVVVIVMSALYFFTGIKIRKQQNIGRILGIVISVLSLFSIPLGTALGIYGLWFFLGDLGKSLYLGQPSFAGPIGNNPQPQPPPPNSWQ